MWELLDSLVGWSRLPLGLGQLQRHTATWKKMTRVWPGGFQKETEVPVWFSFKLLAAPGHSRTHGDGTWSPLLPYITICPRKAVESDHTPPQLSRPPFHEDCYAKPLPRSHRVFRHQLHCEGNILTRCLLDHRLPNVPSDDPAMTHTELAAAIVSVKGMPCVRGSTVSHPVTDTIKRHLPYPRTLC